MSPQCEAQPNHTELYKISCWSMEKWVQPQQSIEYWPSPAGLCICFSAFSMGQYCKKCYVCWFCGCHAIDSFFPQVCQIRLMNLSSLMNRFILWLEKVINMLWRAWGKYFKQVFYHKPKYWKLISWPQASVIDEKLGIPQITIPPKGDVNVSTIHGNSS